MAKSSGMALCAREIRPATPGQGSWSSAVWKKSPPTLPGRGFVFSPTPVTFRGSSSRIWTKRAAVISSSPVFKAKSFLPTAHRAGFKRMHFGWGVAELRYKPQKWKHAHRFIVVRRPVEEDADEAEQLTLFQLGRFKYSVDVTNLELKAGNVWRAYHSRANIERSIRELFGTISPSTKSRPRNGRPMWPSFRCYCSPMTWCIGSSAFVCRRIICTQLWRRSETTFWCCREN